MGIVFFPLSICVKEHKTLINTESCSCKGVFLYSKYNMGLFDES